MSGLEMFAYCSACGETIGRSPTGAWCLPCGYSSPGFECSTCKRDYVGVHHIDLENGAPCSLSEADLKRSPSI